MKRTIITAVFCLLGITVSAQSGQHAMPFVRIDRNPVTAAMAGAGSVSASTISYASFGNSSVIPFSVRKFDISAAYINWSPGELQSTGLFAGAGGRIGDRAGVSGGIYYSKGTEYERFGENGKYEGVSSPEEFMLSGGFAFRLTDNISAGVNLYYAGQTLGSTMGAFAGDIAVAYRLGGLNLSAGVKSLGSSVTTDGGAYSLPASVNAAAAWKTQFAEIHGLELAFDGDCFLNGGISAAAGVQYAFRDMLFLRAGAHLASDTAPVASYAALGCGVKFSGLHIDAAWLTANEIMGNSIAVGIGYCF